MSKIRINDIYDFDEDILEKYSVLWQDAMGTNVHGDRYDYSRVNYINIRTHVTITCPDHGSFLITPKDHLFGRKCPRCT